jgi:hypothetical protein
MDIQRQLKISLQNFTHESGNDMRRRKLILLKRLWGSSQQAPKSYLTLIYCYQNFTVNNFAGGCVLVAYFNSVTIFISHFSILIIKLNK